MNYDPGLLQLAYYNIVDIGAASYKYSANSKAISCAPVWVGLELPNVVIT